MLSDLLFLSLGCALGACVMKIAVDYKDKHLRTERAKTERYRANYEQTRVTLAYYQGSANFAVATPNNDTDAAPLPLDLFTQEDEEALRSGRRVVRMVQGGAK